MDAKEEKFVNIRPAVVACVAMVCGIVCAYRSFLHSFLISLIAFLILGVAFFLPLLFKNENRKKIFIYLFVILLCFTLGYVNTFVRINTATKQSLSSQHGQYVGRIYEKSSYATGTLIYLENQTFSGEKIGGKSTAFIYSADLTDKIDVGAVLSCEANIVNRALSGDNDSDVFSGIYYKLENVANIEIIDFDADFCELGYLKIRAFLKNNLSAEASSVALALILGDTTAFAKYKLENYRYAGVAHVFAVSGLHVGVMVTCFTFLCNKLKIKRKFKPLFILIPAFIYCGLCGFRASSFRAFIMACCSISAGYIGFKKDGLSVSAIAGFVLLLLNPFNLYDYGFKLSFVAATSIFAFAPVITRKLKKLKGVGEPMAITLSAQAGTLPILTQMSGYTSIIAIFTNLLFVPVSVVMYVVTIVCLALSASLSMLFSGATKIMRVADFLICAVDNLISSVDFSIFATKITLGPLAVLWYVGLACVSEYFNFSSRSKTFIFITTVVTVFGIAFLNSLI